MSFQKDKISNKKKADCKQPAFDLVASRRFELLISRMKTWRPRPLDELAIVVVIDDAKIHFFLYRATLKRKKIKKNYFSSFLSCSKLKPKRLAVLIKF